jgi:hypothetical protein
MISHCMLFLVLFSRYIPSSFVYCEFISCAFCNSDGFCNSQVFKFQLCKISYQNLDRYSVFLSISLPLITIVFHLELSYLFRFSVAVFI